MATLIFALAPLNSEVMQYVTTRSAVMTTVFYLAAFLAYLRGSRSFLALFHTLALFTKAIALTLPGVMLLHDVLSRERRRYPTLRDYGRDWGRLARLVAVPACLNLVYLVFRKLALPPGIEASYKQAATTPWVWCMSQWSALLYYVRLFVWPDALCVDRDFPYARSFFEPRAWLALLVLAAWIYLAVRLARHQPLFAFATGWFFLTLSVESSVIPLAEVVNEHRPYIASSLGLSLLVVWLLRTLAGTLPGRVRLAPLIATTLLCTAAIPVIRHRNWVWQDSVRLWLDTVRVSPGNGRAWMNAGVASMARGEFEAARTYFEKARSLYPNYAYVYTNLSVLEARLGNFAAALGAAEHAVRLTPNTAGPYYYLGRVYERMCRFADAAAQYEKGRALNPREPDILAGLARIEMPAAAGLPALMNDGLEARHKAGEPNRGALCFQQMLRQKPDHYGANFQLASALDATGRGDEARPYWTKVLPLAEAVPDETTANAARARLAQPDRVDVPALMAGALDDLHKRQSARTAVTLFESIPARNPRHYGGNFQLATALERLGRHADALPYWKTTLELAESFQDSGTAETARRALATVP